jgi:hypothetical protein
VYAADFLTLDGKTEPAMATFQDIRGTNQRLPIAVGWLMTLQITAEWGSDSLQELISFTEFRHPWGQNSIVEFSLSYHEYYIER